MIDWTDDHMVKVIPVVMPDGEQLTYYGAYGGDNPYGIFFKAGSTVVRGTNSDGAICISPK